MERIKERDTTIDFLRAVAVIWVLVVHTLYWPEYSISPNLDIAKSYLLFEMPLFFFVIGASYSVSTPKPYWIYLRGRIKQVLVPYWKYAGICAVLSVLMLVITKAGVDIWDIILVVLSWLLPFNIQISRIRFLSWALWFMPVFLCIAILIPLFNLARKKNAGMILIAFLLAAFAITDIKNLGWIQNIFFYSIWTALGLYYQQIQEKTRTRALQAILVGTIAVGILGLCVSHQSGLEMDMQKNKFPPNLQFMCLSMILMSVILLALPAINNLAKKMERNKLMTNVSKNSMTLFLYHPFVFLLTLPVINGIFTDNAPGIQILKTVICLCIVLTVCLSFASIEPIKNIQRISRKKTKNGTEGRHES